MDLKQDQKRVKDLLIDTIASLCRDGLTYNENLSIQGVIGITVDKAEVFLVHINQEIRAPGDDENDVEFMKESPNNISIHKFNNNLNHNDIPHLQKTTPDQVKSEPRSPKSLHKLFPNYVSSPNFYSPGEDAQNIQTNKIIKLEDSYINNNSQQQSQQQQNPHYNTINNNDPNPNESEPVNQSSYYENDYYNSTQSQEHNPSYSVQMGSSSGGVGGVGASGGATSGGVKKVNRRRGGRRGGSCGGKQRLPDSFEANTTWESMVATTFVCKVCGQTFVHKSNLLGHQIRIHGRQKNKRGRPPAQNNLSLPTTQKNEAANLQTDNLGMDNTQSNNIQGIDIIQRGVDSMQNTIGMETLDSSIENLPNEDLNEEAEGGEEELMQPINNNKVLVGRVGMGGGEVRMDLDRKLEAKDLRYNERADYNPYPSTNNNNTPSSTLIYNNNPSGAFLPSSTTIIQHSPDNILIPPNNPPSNNNMPNNPPFPSNNNNNPTNFQNNFHHNSPINRSYEMLSNW